MIKLSHKHKTYILFFLLYFTSIVSFTLNINTIIEQNEALLSIARIGVKGNYLLFVISAIIVQLITILFVTIWDILILFLLTNLIYHKKIRLSSFTMPVLLGNLGNMMWTFGSTFFASSFVLQDVMYRELMNPGNILKLLIFGYLLSKMKIWDQKVRTFLLILCYFIINTLLSLLSYLFI